MDVPFPLLSAPGRQTNTAGGRLINCYPERLADTAGKQYAYWRVPGLKPFTTLPAGLPRGSLTVGSLLYVVVANKVYTADLNGTVTMLGGNMPGSTGVFLAANNATTPDIVLVSPGDGAFVVSAGAVINYPDADVGQPNSVAFHKGFFVFTYGNGGTRTSGVNTTAVNTNDYATAESKPDTLYRPVPLGNGQLLLCGSSTIEVWSGQNDTAYPFNYLQTIPRGIVGPYAICGAEDGFGKGIFGVGDDFSVFTLNGYQTEKISPPELDILIEKEPIKSAIRMMVYIANGHSFVAVQGATWCWVYDVGMQSWHERRSYLRNYWRGVYGVKAFDKWLCSDIETGNLVQIDSATFDEMGMPLRMRIETGPFGSFTRPLRVNQIELYLTKGVGLATGVDPVQTNPDVQISMSPNGGFNWRGPRIVKVGQQSAPSPRVRASVWGHADPQGVRWRFEMSGNVQFGFMGADMQADALR